MKDAFEKKTLIITRLNVNITKLDMILSL